MLLAEAGRSLSKDLVSLFRHNLETPHVLERLVQEIHGNKELCSYMFLNHPGSEDMLWGIMNLLSDQDSRIAGNAAYVIGSLAEIDPGKKRIVQICTERKGDAEGILPSLTSMLDMTDPETVMNAAGTMGTLAEDEDCRMWMLREDCLDEAIMKLTKLLACKDKCTASNAALVLARLTIAEEGCARILNLRNSNRILVMLCRALGTDETGCGMNAAFAIGRLCDLEAGCSRILSLQDSRTMIDSLIEMLRCADTGCCKNACFALSCVVSTTLGHARLLSHPDIENIVRVLCFLLASKDDECIWFSTMMLHTLSSQKSGCLFLRKQPTVEPSLKLVLQRPGLKDDTREEAETTLAILEALPKPKPATLTVESAHSILVTWKTIQPKSGLSVTYELYQDSNVVYRGPRNSYIASDLKPVSFHRFHLRTCTEGDDSPYSDVVSATTAESVPSAPQSLRVMSKSTSQIKITWNPPEAANGVLRGYQVLAKGKRTCLSISETHFILSSLPPDVDFTFEVFALTSKGRGESAVLTARTDDLASHAPPKPVLQVLGRHELLIQWNNPPRPLGRINSFEVRLNGAPIYNGVERCCTATSLRPNTEYSVTVSAWCSEGRCESEPVKKTTTRDIYIPTRKPLYPKDRKSSVTKQERGLRRAKTANVLNAIPTTDSVHHQNRTHRDGSSVESRSRSTNVFVSNNKNGLGSQESITRKCLAKRLSKQEDGLSASLDSLKDADKVKTSGENGSRSSPTSSARSNKIKEKQQLNCDANNTGAYVEPNRSRLSKRPSPVGSTRSAKERPSKGRFVRRSSLPVNQKQFVLSSAKEARDLSTKSRVVQDTRASAQPTGEIELVSGELDSLSIKSKTGAHVGDEKPPRPTKKTQFAASFDELKQVHRSEQSPPQQLSKRSKNSNGRKVED